MNENIVYEDQSILIVDDSESNILVIQLILEANKVGHIYTATSAQAAYDILATHDVDAILLDIIMPDIDGIDICKHIRHEKKFDLIPILMITADKGDYSLKKSFDAGANDYIEKPINDIALMGRLNSQLRQRQMEQSIIMHTQYNAKNEITSMLAHQWRQPLSNISSLTSNIQAKILLDKISKEQTIVDLQKVESVVYDLSQLIRSFNITFSPRTSRDIFNINTCFDSILLLMQGLVNEHEIKIDILSNVDKEFELDKESLIQVIVNLLHNSIEALAHDEIKEPNIKIETIYEANQLIIKIKDNGKGIKKEHLKQIFDPYFSTKTQINGKGLGLYMIRQLLTYNLDGIIDVDSDSKGTLVTVTINNKAA
ncbi:MAG: response regulator [Thiovulaceae bacterium]|nr:response regulator [Sulfurimonadaceae bacterium]